MDPHELLSGAVGFEWDAGNADKNWLKHQVHKQVFFNQPLVVAPDVAHSRDEIRLYALGQTDRGRLLFLAFTLRGDRIRVISARDMSRRERQAYANHE